MTSIGKVSTPPEGSTTQSSIDLFLDAMCDASPLSARTLCAYREDLETLAVWLIKQQSVQKPRLHLVGSSEHNSLTQYSEESAREIAGSGKARMFDLLLKEVAAPQAYVTFKQVSASGNFLAAMEAARRVSLS
jgi:site-specific recombinase XerC